MEKITKVEPVRVDFGCPKCEEGNMMYMPSATICASYPVQYRHKCDKCKYEQLFTQTYPRIEYKPIDNGTNWTGGPRP